MKFRNGRLVQAILVNAADANDIIGPESATAPDFKVAKLMIIETGGRTVFNGFQYQFTTRKLLTRLKPAATCFSTSVQ
jgi:hypothetical protein